MTATALYTNTLGYFNPNDFPIQLQIMALNINIKLNPNEFVIDNRGNKINDPIFDNFVGQNKLAKEESKDTVLLRKIRRPEAPVTPVIQNNMSFAGTPNPEFTNTGEIAKLPVAAVPTVATSNRPVKGYTMEQAVELGLIKKLRPLGESTVTDTETGTPDLSAAPQIEKGKLVPVTSAATSIQNTRAGGIIETEQATIENTIAELPEPEPAAPIKVINKPVQQEPVVIQPNAPEEVDVNPAQTLKPVVPQPAVKKTRVKRVKVATAPSANTLPEPKV